MSIEASAATVRWSGRGTSSLAPTPLSRRTPSTGISHRSRSFAAASVLPAGERAARDPGHHAVAMGDVQQVARTGATRPSATRCPISCSIGSTRVAPTERSTAAATQRRGTGDHVCVPHLFFRLATPNADGAKLLPKATIATSTSSARLPRAAAGRWRRRRTPRSRGPSSGHRLGVHVEHGRFGPGCPAGLHDRIGNAAQTDPKHLPGRHRVGSSLARPIHTRSSASPAGARARTPAMAIASVRGPIRPTNVAVMITTLPAGEGAEGTPSTGRTSRTRSRPRRCSEAERDPRSAAAESTGRSRARRSRTRLPSRAGSSPRWSPGRAGLPVEIGAARRETSPTAPRRSSSRCRLRWSRAPRPSTMTTPPRYTVAGAICPTSKVLMPAVCIDTTWNAAASTEAGPGEPASERVHSSTRKARVTAATSPTPTPTPSAVRACGMSRGALRRRSRGQAWRASSSIAGNPIRPTNTSTPIVTHIGQLATSPERLP